MHCCWEVPGAHLQAPVWLDGADMLVLADRAHGTLRCFAPDTGESGEIAVPGQPGFGVPTQEGSLLVGTARELLVLDREGRASREFLLEPGAQQTGHVHVDARGRVWFTMEAFGEAAAEVAGHGQAGLVRYHDERLVRMVFDMPMAGGMALDPEARELLLADGGAHRVRRYRVSRAGSLWEEAPFLDLAADALRPAALARDNEGGVWLAFAGSAHLRHYAADGTLHAQLDVPCREVTGLGFGGRGAEILYICARTAQGAALYTHDLAVPGPASCAVRTGHADIGLITEDDHH
ncbi:SMP-30/gluconolactonase/LRE family protein [Novosphingobium mangrovi (ex Hu et al. 2023)]|uniref:SMP-30/gluconolactonase/LRE family protein n=1 Tax=Novosphingobium mangrovi (ex Hu et al. 2023) TaxID=2930094 RepID=A0ABT0AGP7_9SPHN|nr:SMP-30/gluconolactonase/LRE family protein [Novosphingobium mangrovi (ex Hu et al. 2023)]MCJ1962352.1 SMP-30/gluconolactonase/LRE family protein [Novosphingobium mangrovi (ex Hu et al. 2023)]